MFVFSFLSSSVKYYTLSLIPAPLTFPGHLPLSEEVHYHNRSSTYRARCKDMLFTILKWIWGETFRTSIHKGLKRFFSLSLLKNGFTLKSVRNRRYRWIVFEVFYVNRSQMVGLEFPTFVEHLPREIPLL